MKTQRPLILSLSFLLTAITLSLLIPATAAAADETFKPPSNTTGNCTEFIRNSCSTTLYPDVCFTSLSRYAAAIQQNPASLARVAITVSLANARRMAAFVSNLSKNNGGGDYGGDRRTAAALHDCFSNLGDSVDEIRESLKQMREMNGGGDGTSSFRFEMSNVQTWMSAALTDQETCTDGFEDVMDGPMKAKVCEKAEKVKKHTSNALALVNSFVHKTIP